MKANKIWVVVKKRIIFFYPRRWFLTKKNSTPRGLGAHKLQWTLFIFVINKFILAILVHCKKSFQDARYEFIFKGESVILVTYK